MATSATDYEQLRNARVGDNQKRMQALGLVDLSRSLSSTPLSDNKHARKKPRVFAENPRPPLDNTSRRRSSRLLGTTLPCYAEVTTVKEFDVATIDSRQIQPEVYTEEHEKLLGSCSQEWELFKDGCAADGTRIYDSVRGKTCHQCRQKTLGLRTSCSRCNSLRGQFCGDCLFMRYGENVIEANTNKEWVCPVCRGMCNCSFCRLKKGWAPTGSMYRLALKLNYKSVAHYLVMTRRESSDAKDANEVKIILNEESKEEGLDKQEKEAILEESEETVIEQEKEVVLDEESEEDVNNQQTEVILVEESDEDVKSKVILAEEGLNKELKLSKNPDDATRVRRSLRYSSRKKGIGGGVSLTSTCS
ncbi:hypothetical protein GOP47_0004006 [Adiantum capillus-veneris]|uniref:Zinc-finger domain-containing protein n=1 Tax=Adiantum capillus-veneris TaxID=13818 RepID=A0A9D4V7Z4_ADICA|nr:hypothetical protein GOP47_0004006 [Adiantum capillus-veneris]